MTRFSQARELVRTYASLPVFAACLFALYVLVSIGFRSVIGPVLGGAIGGFVAIIVLLLLKPTVGARRRGPLDYRIAVAVTALYITLMILMYRVTLHERPMAHYAVFGLFAGFVAYEILCGARRVRVVPQLLVLTFVTYRSSQWAFPAGMWGPDTKFRYLPAIAESLATGVIPKSETAYLGHLVYVTESTLITGMTAEATYFLLSILVLTGTLLLLSVIDVALPRIPREVALFAALVFGCMSWTLGRGFQPNKLNFFYPLILLIGLSVLGLYRSDRVSPRNWVLIGTVVSPAIIFGHRFSAGAALVFVGSIAVFSLLGVRLLQDEYTIYPRDFAPMFATAYGLAIVGNPLHQGPLTFRLVSLVTSIFAASEGGGGGGPGRYSQFSLEFLLVNTSAQALLFAFAVFGAAVAIRRVDWEFDFGIFWLAVLAVLLLVSLVFNAADVQPQRFYSLLGLFGLNIFFGLGILYLVKSDFQLFSERNAAVVMACFAVLSLASPIAGMHLSPFGDEIPHYRKYDTNQLTQGSEWVETYGGEDESLLHTLPPSTDLPIESSGQTTSRIVVSEIPSGSRYVYSDVAARTGVLTGGGLNVGGRQFRFLPSPSTSDSVLYTNGGTNVYLS